MVPTSKQEGKADDPKRLKWRRTNADCQIVKTTADTARPSRWWYSAAGLFLVFTIGAIVGAFVHEVESSRPIGEGDLFLQETSSAAQTIADGGSDLTAVKRARNELEIEAISIVSAGGSISTSTSGSLIGTPIDNSVVAFAHMSRAFAAAAMPLSTSIMVDDVEEWDSGDTLYAVVYPLDDGTSVLFHYDISELLSRRSADGGISPGTLVLLAVAVTSAVLIAVALIGRTRAATRFQVLDREAELLRIHTTQLEDRNVELDAARSTAEDALAFAEEKIRIRAEFVLMINHELRTPLTSVLTGAQLLTETDIDETTRTSILDDMLRDGHRLERTISQILTVARIENRGLASTVVETSASQVWEQLAEVVPPQTSRQRSSEVPNVVVRTDPDTLASLVASLVDNASQHGARHVRVAASSTTEIEASVEVGVVGQPGLVISVIDDGPGIEAAFLPRVFEKFEKHSFSSGTGLGLYAVRLMADAIGCSVAVVSGPGGTTFEVRVPATHSRLPAGVV